MQTHLSASDNGYFVSSDNGYFSPPGMGEKRGNTFTQGNVCPAFRQIKGG